MKKYLVVFECPAVGLSEELVGFDTDKQVCEWAWRRSVNSDMYVMGSYDIFRLSYDNHLNLITERVDEEAVWEAEEKAVNETGRDHGYEEMSFL